MNAIPRRLVIVLGMIAGLVPATARGAEPVEAFLEALRQRKYYDQAQLYLDQLAADEQLDAALRQGIPYERALMLMASAADAADPKVRAKRLDDAAKLFEQFSTAAPDHPSAALANNQVANILIEHGRAALQSASADQKEAVAETIRAQFEKARERLAASQQQLDAQLATLPKLIPPDQKDLQTRKRQLTGNLAQTRLLQAGIDYELAKTHAPGSEQSKKHFSVAAENYATLYEQYRTRAVGLLARLSEGRCYQSLGQLTRAIGCFRELVDLADQPETHSIRAKSLRHALECWNDDSLKKYETAIEFGERWTKEFSSGEGDADADNLAIRYLTALAYQGQSTSLPEKDPAREKLIGFARQQVQPVADRPGEYQRPAGVLLVALSSNQKTADTSKSSKSSSKSPSKPPAKSPGKPPAAAPTKFADALAAARESLAELQAVQQQLARGKVEPAEREKLEAQQRETAEQAMRLLRAALERVEKDTPEDQINQARYYLCFTNWDIGRYYDAAVLGEFLADRVPETLFGRQGARIALAAYVRLYSAAPEAERPFVVAQILRVADKTFTHWPDQDEAEEAALTLVNFAAASNQVEKAAEYLAKIPADSPRRAQAELRTGQALAAAYLKALRASEQERPAPEKLAALAKQSKEFLQQGIERAGKSDRIDPLLVAATFAIAQMCLETGETDQAIQWLEHAKFGPLTLLEEKHVLSNRPGFALDTYKLALRAFVAANPQQLDKAEEAMNALEAIVKDDPAGATNLTAIYISLGRQLQQRLQALRQNGKTDQLDALSKSFETFLDRAVKRDSGNSLSSLNWVAETYYSLGTGFTDAGGAQSTRARDYFQKATTAYERMLQMAPQDPAYKGKPDALMALRLRLADCYRRAGQYDQAIAAVAEVLGERVMLLGAQVQAAEIYQSQGTVDPKAYIRAIMGDKPNRNGQNLVWGWAKISTMTMNDEKFADTFHHARLSIAESRYRYALGQDDKDTRAKILQAAVQDLWTTYKLRPTLGGPETAARYDQLLKKLQNALGQSEDGLAEFKKRDAGGAETATP